MEYIEVTGKSVEEAISNACTKLGIPSDKLDYEVIDKGNSGFLGIFNSKPAKIKAREKQEEPEVNSVETPKKSEAPVHAEKKFEKKADDFKKAEPKKEFKTITKTKQFDDIVKSLTYAFFQCSFVEGKSIDYTDINPKDYSFERLKLIVEA